MQARGTHNFSAYNGASNSLNGSNPSSVKLVDTLVGEVLLLTLCLVSHPIRGLNWAVDQSQGRVAELSASHSPELLSQRREFFQSCSGGKRGALKCCGSHGVVEEQDPSRGLQWYNANNGQLSSLLIPQQEDQQPPSLTTCHVTNTNS